MDALYLKVCRGRLDGALGPDLAGRNLAYNRGVETERFLRSLIHMEAISVITGNVTLVGPQ